MELWEVVFLLLAILLAVIIPIILFREQKRGNIKDQLIKKAIDCNPNARGLACIISNDYFGCDGQDNLIGAGGDSKQMEEAFSHLNFVTIVLRNARKDQMEDLIKAIALYQEYPEKFDCFGIVFSGHGGSKRILISNDNKEMDLEDVMIKPFDNKESHIGRFPKLLFIDACRGGRTKGTSNNELSKPANFLIAYSTRYGYPSFGDNKGSFWILKLAAALKANTTKSIGDVVTSVNKEVADEGAEEPEYYNTTVNIVLSSNAGISANETTPSPTECQLYDTDSHKDPLAVTNALDLACFKKGGDRSFDVTHGKWILFRNFEDLNNTWCVVRDEIESGRLGAVGAKCSTRRYDPESYGAGPKTSGRISVFTKENHCIDVGMKLIQLRGVQHDIKYKTNEATQSRNYAHNPTNEDSFCSKYIYWNMGDPVLVRQLCPVPCRFEKFRNYDPTLDQWKINIVNGPLFSEDGLAHGHWSIKIKCNSQFTNLWHRLKDQIDNGSIPAFKMVCPWKHPKSEPEIHVFTTEPTMNDIGSKLIAEVKYDICYKYNVTHGRSSQRIYYWNNGQPGYTEA